MDVSTGNWFNYLQEEVLTEGLRDIGLPEVIIDFIEEGMPNAPEKSKMYAGNNWKEHKLGNPGYIDSTQQNWLSFMERNFEDQIQLPRATHSPVQARTITPYTVDGMVREPSTRVQYDDETIEQNKKIAFVADNIKQAWAKPAGTWRKTFMKAVKALSKAGLPSEKVEVVKDELQRNMLAQWRVYWGRYNELFSWLNDEPTNYELIKGDDIDNAYNTAVQDLENREDPDNILYVFDGSEDVIEDGSYWYNLDVSNCPTEGERMGHCGQDTRGVLVSLRKRQGKRKASSSYVTMTWNANDDVIYQIKGRSNDAPPMEMWDHIEWFIRKFEISSVQETGEHSNDEEGFREMTEYLQPRNRTVNFMGAVDEGAIQEAIDEVTNNYDGENSSIYGELSGPDEHGGEYYAVQMNGDGSLEINLGWPGFELRNNEYTPTIAADDTTQDDRYETIPENTWGSTTRDFVSEIELENMGYDLPGESEIEYEVKMLTGAQPDDEDIDPDYPATAHLIVSFRCYEYESVDDEEDASRIAENFASELKSEFEDKYNEIKETIRAKLAEGGYSVKTAYDRDRAEMTEYELDYWKIYTDKSGLEFWFRPESSADTLVEYGDMPMILKMWGQNPDSGHIDHLYSRAFGRSTGMAIQPRSAARYGSPDLDRNMARSLERMYKKNNAAGPAGQEQLPFGDKYAAKHVPVVLAKDSRFVVVGAASYNNRGQGAGAYPEMPIGWRYTIGVDSSASPEEVQTVKDIVRYFNENPQMVMDAAKETINIALEGSVSLAEATKADVMSGKAVFAAIQSIDSLYAGRAEGNDLAKRAVMIARWINQNFEQMSEVEKHVAWYQYISPIRNQRFNMARNGDIEIEGDDAGKPYSWDGYVQEQLKRMRASRSAVQGYRSPARGEPAPAQESVKKTWSNDVERDNLIEEALSIINERDPSYDLRIYQILIRCSMSKMRGGQRGETETEIRGIDGVTVVSGVTFREDAQNWYSTLRIKFELLGRQSRDDYMKLLLLPSLLKIKGLKITPGGLGKPELVSKEISEVAGFGGMTAGAANAPRQGPFVPTPTPSIQDLIDAWVSSGERVYDIPTDNNEMSYHTMVNVEELWGLITSPFYRNTTREFDSVKKNIINHGTYNPIVVAIGKNGRAKITGGIDIVFAAKDLGMSELPTIFMYQHQV